MRPIATDVCLSVCLLVTTVSATKTAGPIDVPFGVWMRVHGPKPGLPCVWDPHGDPMGMGMGYGYGDRNSVPTAALPKTTRKGQFRERGLFPH